MRSAIRYTRYFFSFPLSVLRRLHLCFLNHISFDGAKPASQSIQYLEAQMLPIVLKFSFFSPLFPFFHCILS